MKETIGTLRAARPASQVGGDELKVGGGQATVQAPAAVHPLAKHLNIVVDEGNSSGE
jgi:hypothetical protein